MGRVSPTYYDNLFLSKAKDAICKVLEEMRTNDHVLSLLRPAGSDDANARNLKRKRGQDFTWEQFVENFDGEDHVCSRILEILTKGVVQTARKRDSSADHSFPVRARPSAGGYTRRMAVPPRSARASSADRAIAEAELVVSRASGEESLGPRNARLQVVRGSEFDPTDDAVSRVLPTLPSLPDIHAGLTLEEMMTRSLDRGHLTLFQGPDVVPRGTTSNSGRVLPSTDSSAAPTFPTAHGWMYHYYPEAYHRHQTPELDWYMSSVAAPTHHIAMGARNMVRQFQLQLVGGFLSVVGREASEPSSDTRYTAANVSHSSLVRLHGDLMRWHDVLKSMVEGGDDNANILFTSGFTDLTDVLLATVEERMTGHVVGEMRKMWRDLLVLMRVSNLTKQAEDICSRMGLRSRHDDPVGNWARDEAHIAAVGTARPSMIYDLGHPPHAATYSISYFNEEGTLPLIITATEPMAPWPIEAVAEQLRDLMHPEWLRAPGTLRHSNNHEEQADPVEGVQVARSTSSALRGARERINAIQASLQRISARAAALRVEHERDEAEDESAPSSRPSNAGPHSSVSQTPRAQALAIAGLRRSPASRASLRARNISSRSDEFNAFAERRRQGQRSTQEQDEQPEGSEQSHAVDSPLLERGPIAPLPPRAQRHDHEE